MPPTLVKRRIDVEDQILPRYDRTGRRRRWAELKARTRETTPREITPTVSALDALLHSGVDGAPTDIELNWWLDHVQRCKRQISNVSVPVGEGDAAALDVLEQLRWADPKYARQQLDWVSRR
jgi:hypothetical protein